MNRRNLLIGIGTAAVGSGAVLGSGALTSVQANRDVAVTTTGDSDAVVGLSSSSPYVTDDSDKTLKINIDGGPNSNGINENAVTNIKGIATITNNSDASVLVGFGTDSSSSSGTATLNLNSSTTVTFSLPSGTTQSLNPDDGSNSGHSVDVDVEVDTTVSNSSPYDSTLEIFAEDNS